MRLAAVALLVALAFAPRDVGAVPLFAQRYLLRCEACHAVLPELNAFGQAFRDRGYRIDGLRRHGTTVVALREQIAYARDPDPGARRVVPAGIVLGAAEIGAVEAFVHENLGSAGGPSALYLGYLAYADRRSSILYRAGLVELTLPHSPGQRNDTLTTYGYEGARVGLDDLTLAAPRWGVQAEREAGRLRLGATLAFDAYGGSAYGGKPLATGEQGRFRTPELSASARWTVSTGVRAGLDALAGTRAIDTGARGAFADAYRRFGISLEVRRGPYDLLAEQFDGRDANADGLGSSIGSSGGYVRVRRWFGAHALLGVREDAAATPASTRTLLWYLEGHVTRHARLLVQQRRAIPGRGTTLEAALTVAGPWPRGR